MDTVRSITRIILAGVATLLFTQDLLADTLQVTKEQAIQQMLDAGFKRVLRAQDRPNGWEMWALKDGLTYEVQFHQATGRFESAVIDGDD